MVSTCILWLLTTFETLSHSIPIVPVASVFKFSWPRSSDLISPVNLSPFLKITVSVLDAALEGSDYLIGDFSGADIMLGHACFMSNRLGCMADEMVNLKAYVGRIEARPAFQTAIQMQ